MISKRWLVWSAIGLVLYFFIQVAPYIGSLQDSGNFGMMTREEAKSAALEAATARFGIPASDLGEARAAHLSDSEGVSYLSKEKLLEAYNDAWDERFPTDVYRVDIPLGAESKLELSLHMKTGELVAWRHATEGRSTGGADEDPALLVRQARETLAGWGFAAEDWEPTGEVAADGAVGFQSRKAGLGEAKLQVFVKPAQRSQAPSGTGSESSAAEDGILPDRAGSELRYRLLPPASFMQYLESQEEKAARLSIYGSMLPQLVLLVLAVVYSGAYSSWTSYRRGAFLAPLFFVLYAAFTFNMAPAFRAQAIESGMGQPEAAAFGSIVFNLMMLAAMALLTYFSAVAGDGLWKSAGRDLWPSWRQPDYGRRVLAGMGRGYLLAFIVLGVQSVTLLALTFLLGSFSSSDVTQSTYNMTYPWLMPLLAWCAGISEELQTRLFGIGLFRRWLTGGARRLLRREPSPRAAKALTFAAMLPASLLWAFGHVGYAIYPVHTRLIELVLIGCLFGWFMLRFGLIAVIFAHVSVNSILMGVQMLFDGLRVDLAGGLFSFAMPLLVAWAIWLLHRRFGSRPPSPSR